MSKALLRSKNIRPVNSPLSMFSSRVLSRVCGMWMKSAVGESRIGEKKKPECVPVKSSRPYGGQPDQVFWRKLEVLRLAGSSIDPISNQLSDPA